MTEGLNLELLGNKSSYSGGQYAEYGKWTHKPFLKAYCIHQNHCTERGSVGPKRFDLQGHSHDFFCQIYHNLSVLPHHFHIPCLHFCFLIRMVRLYTNTRTGNLSVIFFVALLLSELNGEEWTYWGPGAFSPGKIWNLGHLKQLEMCLKPQFFLILSLSMGIHPYSGITSRIAHDARS